MASPRDARLDRGHGAWLWWLRPFVLFGTVLFGLAAFPRLVAPAFGSRPPAWFRDAIWRGLRLSAAGVNMPDALTTLEHLASARDFPAYTCFTSQACSLGEFLETEYAYHHGLFRGLRVRDPQLASLPAPPRETERRRQQREEYNLLRRDPPMIRRMRGVVGRPFRTHALQRSEWVGECVGGIHDFFLEGFNLRGVFETMIAYIDTRRDATYRCLALPYYREALGQLDTFHGPAAAVSPRLAAEWVADREAELWYMFCTYGLEATDTDPDDLLLESDSDSSASVTGDESSLMERRMVNKRWLKPATRRRRKPSRTAQSSGPRVPPRSAPSPRVVIAAKCEVTEPVPDRKKPLPRLPRHNTTHEEVVDPPPPPASSSSRLTTGRSASLSTDTAVDTWLLLLGIRDIDEPIGEEFLPERVRHAVVEQFLDYAAEDRLTFTAAFNRIASYLAPMHDAPGRDGEDGDGESESSIYMQTSLSALPTPGASMRSMPWHQLLALFQEGLDLLPKDVRATRVERMLSWLDHRCTRESEGYMLGHVQGAPAELLAVWLTLLPRPILTRPGLKSGSSLCRHLDLEAEEIGMLAHDEEEAKRDREIDMARDDDLDEDQIPTPVLDPGARARAGQTLVEAVPPQPTSTTPAGVGEDPMAAADRDLQIVLNFAEYQGVYAQWVAGSLSSAEVLRRHGRSVLDLVQSQWAFAAGDTIEAEARVAALGGVPLDGVEGTIPDSQDLLDTVPVMDTGEAMGADDWEDLFLNYKAGLVSDSVIGQVLGEQVRLELVRRWRVYMGGAEAYQDAQRELEGSFGFVAQLAPGRSQKRALGLGANSTRLPFNGERFHFGKVEEEEVLFCFDPRRDICTQASSSTCPVSAAAGHRSCGVDSEEPAVVIINKHPACRNHFLLVPAVKERRPQELTQDALALGLAFAFQSSQRLWLSFNSIGAGASVNHLHLQGFCAGACDGSWSFPFEAHLLSHGLLAAAEPRGPISLSRTRGGPKGWPLVGWVFTWTEEKVLEVDANLAAFRLAEFVHRLVDALQVLDMAHNVLINMGRRQVIVFPRRTLFEQSFDVSQLQVSGHETLGWWVVAKDSSDLDEARALELLAKAALDKRGHQKVLQILEWIGWRLREEAKIGPQ
eukprot:s151_g11.t1